MFVNFEATRGIYRANSRAIATPFRSGLLQRGIFPSRVGAPRFPLRDLQRGRGPGAIRGQKTIGKFPRHVGATIPYGPPGITPARVPMARPITPPTATTWRPGQTNRYQPYQLRQGFQQYQMQQARPAYPKVYVPRQHQPTNYRQASQQPTRQVYGQQNAYGQPQTYLQGHQQGQTQQPNYHPQQSNGAMYPAATAYQHYYQPGTDHSQHYPYKR